MSYLLSFAAGAMAMWIVATDVYPGVACHRDAIAFIDDFGIDDFGIDDFGIDDFGIDDFGRR